MIVKTSLPNWRRGWASLNWGWGWTILPHWLLMYLFRLFVSFLFFCPGWRRDHWPWLHLLEFILWGSFLRLLLRILLFLSLMMWLYYFRNRRRWWSLLLPSCWWQFDCSRGLEYLNPRVFFLLSRKWYFLLRWWLLIGRIWSFFLNHRRWGRTSFCNKFMWWWLLYNRNYSLLFKRSVISWCMVRRRRRRWWWLGRLFLRRGLDCFDWRHSRLSFCLLFLIMMLLHV